MPRVAALSVACVVVSLAACTSGSGGTAAPVEAPAPPAPYSTPARAGSFTVTVDEPKCSTFSGGQQCDFRITLLNASNDPADFSAPLDVLLFDEAGRRYKSRSSISELSSYNGTLNPGVSDTGYLGFDVGADVRPVGVEVFGRRFGAAGG